MKKHDFTFSRTRYYFIMSILGFLMLLYLVHVVRPLIALAYHQKFSGIPLEQSKHAVQTLETAIRFDHKNSRYHADLGAHLHQYYAEHQNLEAPQRESGFQDAEELLTRAVMLNPGDPWNYYELGRLGLTESNEKHSSNCSSYETLESCLPSVYFLTTLRRAPLHLFLRRTVGGWFYEVDSKNAFSFLRPALTHNSVESTLPQRTSLEHSKFLYDIQRDYESDLQFEGEENFVEFCPQTSDTSGRIDLEQSPLELSDDDGSSEWRVYLVSETERIRKVICLPDNLDEYRSAALKVFMNNGGSGNFTASFSINDRLIKQFNANDPVPRNVAWYAIPFDLSILQGHPSANVYIRVEGASMHNNFLQVRGDRDTPTTRSMLNFNTRKDLSSDKGIQTGEYMIRLLLMR